jgi:hypothetical protein
MRPDSANSATDGPAFQKSKNNIDNINSLKIHARLGYHADGSPDWLR